VQQKDQWVIARPDDWHVHLRDDEVLNTVLPDTARQFARAIVMPNLKPPVTTTEAALAYYDRIMKAVPRGVQFTPLMTLYLTDNMVPEEIYRARESGVVHAVKWYPAGATTNSDAGVTNWQHCVKVFDAMQEVGMPLSVHGEVTDREIDIFDREAVFIERILEPVRKRFPELKVVFEHITTKDAVQYVEAASGVVGATVTAHHLLYNRNALLVGGVHPHYYCLPVLKREEHRAALLRAVSSGSPRFFLGTDSAPHAKGVKENACGCAGCYTAHHAMELYATAFDQVGAMDKLEGFSSWYGADFYGLPRNMGKVVLTRQEWQIPSVLSLGKEALVPLNAGEKIMWKLEPHPNFAVDRS
jgi:dihydroorotase